MPKVRGEKLYTRLAAAGAQDSFPSSYFLKMLLAVKISESIMPAIEATPPIMAHTLVRNEYNGFGCGWYLTVIGFMSYLNLKRENVVSELV